MHIYAQNDPPLWQAYLDAVKYYGFDGWFMYSGLDISNAHSTVTTETRWLEQTAERWVQELHHPHLERGPACRYAVPMRYPAGDDGKTHQKSGGRPAEIV